jgi:hypothetical protein
MVSSSAEHKFSAFTRERARASPPDPSARARDDGYFVFQLFGHDFIP